MVDEKTLQDPIDPVDTDQLAQAPEGEVLVKADDNFFNQVYSDFWDKGYSGDKNDFFQLLCSNPEAFNDAYELVSSQGYKGSVDDFKAQLGVTEEAEKKKSKQHDRNWKWSIGRYVITITRKGSV